MVITYSINTQSIFEGQTSVPRDHHFWLVSRMRIDKKNFLITVLYIPRLLFYLIYPLNNTLMTNFTSKNPLDLTGDRTPV